MINLGAASVPGPPFFGFILSVGWTINDRDQVAAALVVPDPAMTTIALFDVDDLVSGDDRDEDRCEARERRADRDHDDDERDGRDGERDGRERDN